MGLVHGIVALSLSAHKPEPAIPLPRRPFLSLAEAAGRWACAPRDIAGWAAEGQIELLASIPPVRAGPETLSGIVAVSAAELLSLFRIDGAGPRAVPLRRARPLEEGAWRVITDPAEGVPIEAADLMIRAEELARFEREHELGPKCAQPGPEPRYDWDAMWVQVVRRIHEQGLPESQAEFVGEMQEWFARRSETGDAPDERTLRRRLTPVWRALREDG